MTAPRRLAPGDPALAQVLGLLHRAFAYMEGRIDPPSSLLRLDAAAMDVPARAGEVWALGDPVRATVTLTPQEGALYLGKLAVDEAARGRGLARGLVDLAGARARALGLPRLRLQVRVELTGNQRAFSAMGFVEVARHAHPGYASPTSITFEKDLP
ncbi:GNAT family N-acetyltransferase [Wenxinia saemankumensis]|uniref:Ribosomal protein S18 acetylase RimI n=1 Tax=Wenxinia saemankumensis TaxID=1447782 RepID=A0A1M6E3I7_9RHOB|nr:GNAT family N-acetyltransferase [Wenxinia saemankumensis]SHI80104.1 Ribosomal protein S18 acetylase RimI [Wenxinia saemankumensis]